MCAYLTIDPGINGGISYYSFLQERITCFKMIDDNKLLFNEILKLYYKEPIIYGMIERVSGYIGNAHPGSRMFNFGMNYGSIRMLYTAFSIEYKLVLPQTWQSFFGITTRIKNKDKDIVKNNYTESKSDFKNRLKDLVVPLYKRYGMYSLIKSQKVTLATSDSLLLMLYCLLVKGKPNS